MHLINHESAFWSEKCFSKGLMGVKLETDPLSIKAIDLLRWDRLVEKIIWANELLQRGVAFELISFQQKLKIDTFRPFHCQLRLVLFLSLSPRRSVLTEVIDAFHADVRKESERNKKESAWNGWSVKLKERRCRNSVHSCLRKVQKKFTLSKTVSQIASRLNSASLILKYSRSLNQWSTRAILTTRIKKYNDCMCQCPIMENFALNSISSDLCIGKRSVAVMSLLEIDAKKASNRLKFVQKSKWYFCSLGLNEAESGERLFRHSIFPSMSFNCLSIFFLQRVHSHNFLFRFEFGTFFSFRLTDSVH